MLNYSPEAASSHSDSDVIWALSAVYSIHTPLAMESMSEIPRLPRRTWLGLLQAEQ